MVIKTLRIDEITECQYNPRKKLTPADREYQEIKASIEAYGMVEPLVVNEVTMNCVGGNQRLTVLRDMGIRQVDAVIINEKSDEKEKALCLALNKIDGEWDEEKLYELLSELDEQTLVTGFDRIDEEELERKIAGLTCRENDFDGETYGEGETEFSYRNINAKIGAYNVIIEYDEYRNLIDSIMEKGIFAHDEIAEEIKRRLLNGKAG